MTQVDRFRTLGLLGGMSWESTAVYYRLINQGVAARGGGLHSAPLLLHSLDFAGVAAAQAAGDWAGLGAQLGAAAAGLVRAGAGAVLIATNTMHRLAAEVQAAAGVPLLHIGDATGAALRAAGVKRAGLLGTRFTMEDVSVLRGRLAAHHGIETLVPGDAARTEVHRVIYEELCRGRLEGPSRERYAGIIDDLRRDGAEVVILGCTEIGLLIGAADSTLPVFDTTQLHAAMAVDWICS
ncbi:MAG: aspartate/glutamate racemase family protein [Burkholderiaceae bacterium]|nr:aspartate/glutamate racemase family protein [Burkholderiaceae bacterium]